MHALYIVYANYNKYLFLDSKDGHKGYIEIKTCAPILVTKRSTLDKKLLSCNILTISELQQDRRY